MADNPTKIPKYRSDNNSGSQLPIQHKSRKGGLRSFSNLMIGSLALGLEELNFQMKKWDDKSQINQIDIESDVVSNQPEQPLDNINLIPYEIIEGDFPQDDLRFALVGLLYDTQGRLLSSVQTMRRIGGSINRFTYPIIKPLNRNWLIPPLRRRYDSLIERGENELNRLILVGRSEYEQSRRMAQIAIDDSFDEAVESLATKPEVQDLIQSQGIGLAGEVINEMRERTISADNFIDGIFRSILRRKPRSLIPPPKFEIQ